MDVCAHESDRLFLISIFMIANSLQFCMICRTVFFFLVSVDISKIRNELNILFH